MKISRITIDSVYFLEDIEEKMFNRNITPEQIISITENEDFTTLWYWDNK